MLAIDLTKCGSLVERRKEEERERERRGGSAKPSGAERTRAANSARGMEEGGDGSTAEGVASAATEGGQ